MMSVPSSASATLDLPVWATVGEKRRKYGKAKTLGAGSDILVDEDLTDGFLEAKLSQGNMRLVSMLSLLNHYNLRLVNLLILFLWFVCSLL